MDAFSASLMADKREIIFAPTVYKFQTFAQMAEEFKLGERDVVLTNEFIYTCLLYTSRQIRVPEIPASGVGPADGLDIVRRQHGITLRPLLIGRAGHGHIRPRGHQQQGSGQDVYKRQAQMSPVKRKFRR